MRKGPQKASPKKKMKFKQKPQSKATKTKKPKQYACSCGSGNWCKKASAFFSINNDTLSGFFKITKKRDPSERREIAIKQILRHLDADTNELEKRGEVRIAKHHYSRRQVEFMGKNRLAKLYTKEELNGVYPDPIDSDRIDGDKWIIPPSQTRDDVLKLMKAGIMDSEEGSIYGFDVDDDCFYAEDWREASEDGSDDEEDDAFNQNVQADEAVVARWNLWKDEYHERFPEKSKQLFGLEWIILKIILESRWEDFKFTGCEKKGFHENFTEFESLLVTMHFFHSGNTYTEMNYFWYAGRKKISAAIKACSPKLGELGQMMYDVPLDKEIIRAMQPEKYPKDMLESVGAHVYGHVYQCEVPSGNNEIGQHMYNDKTKGTGLLGLAWTLPCGMVVAATPLYLGNTSEKSAVFHYGLGSTCITDLPD